MTLSNPTPPATIQHGPALHNSHSLWDELPGAEVATIVEPRSERRTDKYLSGSQTRALIRAINCEELRANVLERLTGDSALDGAGVARGWCETILREGVWRAYQSPQITKRRIAPRPTVVLERYSRWNREQSLKKLFEVAAPVASVISAIVGLATALTVGKSLVEACAERPCNDNPVCKNSDPVHFCSMATTFPTQIAGAVGAFVCFGAIYTLANLARIGLERNEAARSAATREARVHASTYAQLPATLRLAEHLTKAARSTDRVDALKKLVNLGAPVNLPNGKRQTALTIAVRAGNEKGVRYLVAQGATADPTDLIRAFEFKATVADALLSQLSEDNRRTLIGKLPAEMMRDWVITGRRDLLAMFLCHAPKPIATAYLVAPIEPQGESAAELSHAKPEIRSLITTYLRTHATCA